MKTETNNFIIIFIALFFISTQIFAQNQSVKTIGVEDGLSSPSVTCIFQDSDGLMWFGTSDGLNMYDGKTITVFRNIPGDSTSLNNNLVYFISEDKNNNLWISTGGTVSKMDRITRKFKSYNFLPFMINPNLLANAPRATTMISTKNGEVFISYVYGGVLQYNEKTDRFRDVQIEPSTYFVHTGLLLPLLFKDSSDNIYMTLYNRPGFYKKEASDSVFRKTPLSNSDSDLLGDEATLSILPLNQDSLLILTNKGIHVLGLPHYQLSSLYKFKNPGPVSPLIGMKKDNKGNIWITSPGDEGVLVYNRASKEMKSYTRFDLESNTSIAGDRTTAIYHDQAGLIWLGTDRKGIMITDPSREPFQLYQHEPKNPKSISASKTFAIRASAINPDLIYVGTAGGGISILNEKTNEFEKFPIEPVNDFYITGSARSILEREDGKLWVGTWGDGLRLYDLKSKTYISYTNQSKKGYAIKNDKIRTLEMDEKGNVWAGGDKGLDLIDQNGNAKTYYYKNNASLPEEALRFVGTKIKASFGSLTKMGDNVDTTLKIEIKKDGYYCLVSVGEGDVNQNDPAFTKSSVQLFDYGWLENKDHQIVASLNPYSDYNFYLSGANKNRISILWEKLSAGTYYLRYKSDESHAYGKWNSDEPAEKEWWGVNLFPVSLAEANEMEQSKKTTVEKTVLSVSTINVLRKDKSGNMYIGSSLEGFQVLKTETMTSKIYRANSNNINSLSNNRVNDIYLDSKNMVWIATNDGLNKFDPSTGSFRKYSTENGLSSNYFSSILEDEHNNIWVSSATGISRLTFDQKGSVSVVNYDRTDGLQRGGFTSLVAARSSSGKLYFGGDNGLNAFYPGQVNTNPPVMAFTGISISKTEDKLPDLIRRLFAGENVILSHDQCDINIDFAALHYTRTEKNKFSHQLVGHDEDWVSDNRNFAGYTNLAPGDYTFKIKGSNSDGYWSDGNKSFSFTILPPWWATWWAYGFYGLFIFGSIYSVGIVQKKRIIAKGKAKLLEAENKRKSMELEEARQLQLSMLPKILPDLSNYEIAVYMKTATEVGGDYYDFHVSSDGTLTIVIGDATGHGLKAGTLVTAAKSLFSILGPNNDILFSLKEFSRCILSLDFNRLSMSLTILKLNGNQLKFGSAGMPPVYIYRSESKSVEELTNEGAPLGTFIGFPYEVRSQSLRPNDVLLLLTDGFPEMINSNGEVFNYNRVSDLFRKSAHMSPDEIIIEFEKSAVIWNHNKEIDDDITFVILKMK